MVRLLKVFALEDVNVFLGSAVRRQEATEVWEVVDLLEVGFTDGDVKNWKRCFWSGLVDREIVAPCKLLRSD